MIKALLLSVLFLIGTAYAESETNFAPEPTDLEMSVRTDKKSYFACEPVTVIVSFTNKTDKTICIPFAKYDQWLLDYSLALLSPVNSSKNIIEEGESWKLEERKAQSAPLSRYYRLSYGWCGDKGCFIPPKGTYNFKIPLSRCFDLSFPPGEYVVTVRRTLKHCFIGQIETYAERSTSFEMKWEHASSQKIAFENMSQMMGRWKTIGILCDEAARILSELERKEEADAVYSTDYDRLMMILRTLDDVVDFKFSKINRSFIWEDGKLFPEETRTFLEHSRQHPIIP